MPYEHQKKSKMHVHSVKNKDGTEKMVIHDESKANDYGSIIKEIHNHDTCLDIFRDLLDVVKTNKKEGP